MGAATLRTLPVAGTVGCVGAATIRTLPVDGTVGCGSCYYKNVTCGWDGRL